MNKYYEGDLIKENQTEEAYYIVGKAKEKGSLGRAGRSGMIILK
jgi:hypothetical protein